jgi:hypothetical protein
MPDEAEFHLQEHRYLQETIEARIKECGTSAQYALAASAAVISWLATASSAKVNPVLYALAWWSPLMVCGFAALRAVGVITRIMVMSKYVMELEEKFADKGIAGWERYLENQRRTTKYAKINTAVSVAFWVAMVGSTALVGYIGSTFTLATPVQPPP